MNELEFFNSKEFKDRIRKRIEEDTWGKGQPMYYMDQTGWLVEHWKDGTIKYIKDLKKF